MSIEHWIAIGVLVWAVWLAWNGRASSPRNRQREARIDELLRQAAAEKRRES